MFITLEQASSLKQFIATGQFVKMTHHNDPHIQVLEKEEHPSKKNQECPHMLELGVMNL